MFRRPPPTLALAAWKALNRTRAVSVLAVLALGGALAAGMPARAEEAGLRERLARAELLAGLTPVEGPGLTVTLRHSPKRVPKGADRSGFMLHDQDVNAVLNALRAAGAEALAIGSGSGGSMERLLANTATVDAKEGLRVNGSTFKAPYRVLAIGDVRALRAELYRKNGVVKRAGLDVMEMIQAEDAGEIRIPAAKSVRPFRYARAAGGSSPTVASGPGFRPAVETDNERPERVTRAAVRKGAPGPPAEAPATAVALRTGSLFGGKGLAKYHAAGCRFGERIELARRVTFRSAAEARRAGRVPCPFCHPDEQASAAGR